MKRLLLTLSLLLLPLPAMAGNAVDAWLAALGPQVVIKAAETKTESHLLEPDETVMTGCTVIVDGKEAGTIGSLSFKVSGGGIVQVKGEDILVGEGMDATAVRSVEYKDIKADPKDLANFAKFALLESEGQLDVLKRADGVRIGSVEGRGLTSGPVSVETMEAKDISTGSCGPAVFRNIAVTVPGFGGRIGEFGWKGVSIDMKTVTKEFMNLSENSTMKDIEAVDYPEMRVDGLRLADISAMNIVVREIMMNARMGGKRIESDAAISGISVPGVLLMPLTGVRYDGNLTGSISGEGFVDLDRMVVSQKVDGTVTDVIDFSGVFDFTDKDGVQKGHIKLDAKNLGLDRVFPKELLEAAIQGLIQSVPAKRQELIRFISKRGATISLDETM